MDWLNDAGNKLGLDFPDIGRALIRIAIIIAVALVADRIVRARLESALARRSFGRSGSFLVSRTISGFIFITCGILIFGTIGASWTGLLTVVSAGTVAIALSIQDVLKNFVSGIFLLLERPFRTGDHIRIRDIEGEVQGIDVRTTLVKERDGTLAMIPNSIVFTEVLANRSRRGTQRIDLEVTLSGISVWDAERRIEQALGSIDSVRKPIPAPSVKSLSNSESIMNMSVLVEASPTSERTVVQAISEALPEATVRVTNP